MFSKKEKKTVQTSLVLFSQKKKMKRDLFDLNREENYIIAH